MPSLKMEFPDEDARKQFLAWFCDGGGEQQFMDSCDMHREGKPIVSIDYRYAFPAWGYDPEKDGEMRVIIEEGEHDS